MNSISPSMIPDSQSMPQLYSVSPVEDLQLLHKFPSTVFSIPHVKRKSSELTALIDLWLYFECISAPMAQILIPSADLFIWKKYITNTNIA